MSFHKVSTHFQIHGRMSDGHAVTGGEQRTCTLDGAAEPVQNAALEKVVLEAVKA